MSKHESPLGFDLYASPDLADCAECPLARSFERALMLARDAIRNMEKQFDLFIAESNINRGELSEEEIALLWLGFYGGLTARMYEGYDSIPQDCEPGSPGHITREGVLNIANIGYYEDRLTCDIAELSRVLSVCREQGDKGYKPGLFAFLGLRRACGYERPVKK